MQGGFTVAFVDLVAYILPGGVLLAALFFLWRARAEASVPGPWVLLVVVVAASYVLGLALHRLAAMFVYPSYLLTGQNELAAFVLRFNQYAVVNSRLSGILGFEPADPVDMFVYAKSFVVQNARDEALASERLLHLSLLCRSLVVAIPLAGLATAAALLQRAGQFGRVFAVIGCAAVLTALLYRSWMIYNTASVDTILRAFLIASAE